MSQVCWTLQVFKHNPVGGHHAVDRNERCFLEPPLFIERFPARFFDRPRQFKRGDVAVSPLCEQMTGLLVESFTRVTFDFLVVLFLSDCSLCQFFTEGFSTRFEVLIRMPVN